MSEEGKKEIGEATKRSAEDSDSSSGDEYFTMPSSQNPHSSRHYKPTVKKPKISETTPTDEGAGTSARAEGREEGSEDSQSSHTSGESMPSLEGDTEKRSAEDLRMMKQIAKVKKMNQDELGELEEEPPEEKTGLLDAFVTQTEPELLLAISGDHIPEEGKHFGDLMEDPAADALLLTRYTDGPKYKITAAAVAREWEVTTDQSRQIVADSSRLRPAEVAQQLAAQDYKVRSVQVTNLFYISIFITHKNY